VTPLPPPLGSGELVAWRLDPAIYEDSWDSGIGAARRGGRWNSAGTHAVYCSLDPATAIIEVAVHVGFDDLDGVPRVLTSLTILAPAAVHVVNPPDVPNPNWLRPGRPSANQQRFGDALLAQHGMLVIPSAVSSHSWNFVFLAGVPVGSYSLRGQERFALDTRLAS
jgi:RES domain-containing protein